MPAIIIPKLLKLPKYLLQYSIKLLDTICTGVQKNKVLKLLLCKLAFASPSSKHALHSTHQAFAIKKERRKLEKKKHVTYNYNYNRLRARPLMCAIF